MSEIENNYGTKSRKYAEAMQFRDWQTCDLICDEHKELMQEIEKLENVVKNETRIRVHYVDRCMSLDEKISKLEAANKVLMDAVEFYSNGYYYSPSGKISQDDFSEEEVVTTIHLTGINRKNSCNGTITSSHKRFGKRAREALKKYQELIKD